jgi:hypothetical protein
MQQTSECVGKLNVADINAERYPIPVNFSTAVGSNLSRSTEASLLKRLLSGIGALISSHSGVKTRSEAVDALTN